MTEKLTPKSQKGPSETRSPGNLTRQGQTSKGSTRKVHIHCEQFDGAFHPWCGRGNTAVPTLEFEATPSRLRCKLCEADWFPNGQPEGHRLQAEKALKEERAITQYYEDRARSGQAALAK